LHRPGRFASGPRAPYRNLVGVARTRSQRHFDLGRRLPLTRRGPRGRYARRWDFHSV
jgi:hypothetical protein